MEIYNVFEVSSSCCSIKDVKVLSLNETTDRPVSKKNTSTTTPRLILKDKVFILVKEVKEILNECHAQYVYI